MPGIQEMNNTMNIIKRNQEMKRMNHDIRRMREQIDVLKNKLGERMIERANLVCSEVYSGAV